MKKSILFCSAAAFLISGTTVNAQTFTNAGMENWTDSTIIALPPYTLHRPDGWHGTDELMAANAVILQTMGLTASSQVSKSTDAHGGSYAAKIKTVEGNATLGNIPGALANASMTLDITAIMNGVDLSNLADAVTFNGGTPIPAGKKVDSVKAWVKLTTDNTDSAAVVIIAMAGTTPIGRGTLTIGQNSDYQQVNIPMIYNDPNTTLTDSLIVMFSSSAVSQDTSVTTPTTVGNTLLVDDVSMYISDGSNNTAIELPVISEQPMIVYPNPSRSGMVYFNLNTKLKASEYSLVISDITGKVIFQKDLSKSINAIDCSHYADGTYFYTLQHNPTHHQQNGKFVIGK